MGGDNEHFFGHYAGFGSRMFAYIIDLVISVAFISFLWMLVNLTIDLLKVREVLAALEWLDFYKRITGTNTEIVWRGVILTVGVGLYHIVCISLANRTIGKGIMGLQVIPLKGGRVGLLQATVRYLGYIVSTIPFFFGFIWILFSRKRQGWHDKLSRTCVGFLLF